MLRHYFFGVIDILVLDLAGFVHHSLTIVVIMLYISTLVTISTRLINDLENNKTTEANTNVHKYWNICTADSETTFMC